MRYGSFLSGVLLGAGVVALVWAFQRSGVEDSEALRDASLVRAPGGPDAAVAAVLARLDRLERKLDARAPAPHTIEADVPFLAGAGTVPDEPSAKRQPADDASGPVEIDVDSLQAALDEIETRRWAALSDDAVRREAKRLLEKARDPIRAEKALEHLLGRELSTADRATVLMQLGMARRSTGELEGSTEALRRAVDLVGVDSDVGVQAGLQLAWTLARRKQFTEGMRVAEEVARAQSATGQGKVNAEWAIAVLAQGSGDAARAQREFERLLGTYGDDPAYEWLAKDVRRRLEALR